MILIILKVTLEELGHYIIQKYKMRLNLGIHQNQIALLKVDQKN